ncbi:MAG: YccF domain-containing protein, partial [Salibacteraceae bacterium]
MKTIGNLIWVVFGGLFIALEYFVASLVLIVTIIGIPFGIQTMKLALVALWPFGTKIRESETSSGCLSVFMNVFW